MGFSGVSNNTSIPPTTTTDPVDDSSTSTNTTSDASSTSGAEARDEAAQNTAAEQSTDSGSSTGTVDDTSYTDESSTSEDYSWNDSQIPVGDDESYDPALESIDDPTLNTEASEESDNPRDLALLRQVQQQIKDAKNAKELQQADQCLPTAEDIILVEETSTEELAQQEQAEEKKSKQEQQRLALATLPKSILQPALKQFRVKAQQLMAQAESAEEKSLLKTMVTTRSNQLKQMAREQTEKLKQNAFELAEDFTETTENLFKSLMDGGKKFGKEQLSDFNKRVASASTPDDKITESEKKLIEENTPDFIKAGVGGEKDLTPKELKMIEQRRIAQENAKKEAAELAKSEASAGESTESSAQPGNRLAQKKTLEQKSETSGSDPRKAVSVEHIAQTVIPVLAQKSEQVRAKLEDLKKKGLSEMQAMVAIASGQAFAAQGTDNADEASLFEQASATFGEQMGRVQKFAGEKQEQAAQYAAATLSKASQLLQQGRSAVASALVTESQRMQDGSFELNSNPANQTHLSEEELRSGYYTLMGNSNAKAEAQNEPGQTRESTLAREFHQYWDGSVAQDMAGRFQSMFSDRKA